LKTIAVALFSITAATIGIAWASTWDDAKSKSDDFKRRADETRKVAAEQAHKIVGAVCAASDDDRKSAADRASSDARSRLSDKYNALERAKRDALDAIEKVERDDTQKDKRSDASRLSSDIKSQWDKISDATRGLRDGRHPVVDYMLSRGESARRDHRDRCSVRDISVGSERAECVLVSSDTCTIVSLTADSSNAIGRGRDRARRAASSLESLISKNSVPPALAKCKRVETRVDCFKLCPDIDDDGRLRDTSASWRERC
jgi:hypothetical protein